MTCTCDSPGFCPVFGKVQAEHHLRICRGEALTPDACAIYRANWARLKDQREGKRPANADLTDAEVAELLPGEDPTLIGNRIAALTTALGIPPCGGCGKRKEWLNKAHALLRRMAGP